MVLFPVHPAESARGQPLCGLCLGGKFGMKGTTMQALSTPNPEPSRDRGYKDRLIGFRM